MMNRHVLSRMVASLVCIAMTIGAWAQDILPDSTLRQLAANMLMVGFKGDSVYVGSDAYRYVHDLRVGSIVLFDVDLTGDATIGSRNITSEHQVNALTNKLQQWASGNLLIAADQEGGRVARLKPQYGFQPTISAGKLGEIDCTDTTRLYARRIAHDLTRAGINVNLAPDVDIYSDSCPVIGGAQRSFGSDPQLIARHAAAFVDEHHQHNVMCVLKHFPGHGSAHGDTHYGLVDITHTWDESELIPFKLMIGQGQADLIMTAHVYNRNIDPDLPATLSPKFLNDILRVQLGYDGVVVTDDMFMEGIVGEYGIEDAMVMAINAGADMICAGNNGAKGYVPERPFQLTDIIVRAVRDGRIPIERVLEANRRINTLKTRIQTGN